VRSTLLILGLMISLLCSAAMASADASAQFSTVAFRAPNEGNINGIRFSVLHGENSRMSGLDLGFVALSQSDSLSGAAFVFGAHKLTGAMDGGAAFSLVNLHSGNDTGLNAAFFNKLNNAEGAVDFGFVNIADGTTLVDIGCFNMAKESKVQLGFINVANEITGLQLGFLNVADNGFFPVFPFFNFPKP
jgi:hypothetical protein